ncbi:MAG: type II toxin-antitoxin system RatA family toxin [Rhodocyclaceae bacterium]|jgi:ribosome-associated toxin RatA of RatAB toxin-antitoxin module|nr:type II toxin-antitoxin system RatA family toxin [Rhodocyclaceae bacterium]MBK6553416.1 type II toxin-antitoxin system RatA family toxin [Rhodocyclaceae bacterium]MBK9311563.1 type II toxin-antitoxin system RatA family toxin [Rhodocyclaceae bacterium]MBK9956402.1 type II toxin-antitoxin system RatA family toxin [Rhodocyclaceae bacterium]
MAVVEKSVLIERTAAQMFELVDRVEDYPKFLPWCGGSELIERTESRTSARLHINYHGLKAHFATENPKESPRWMDIKLREGPFRHLDGGWKFTPLGDAACKVEFRLHYEFSSKVLEKALGPVFHHIANTFVESFVKRAQQIYG